ncbi:hypothetical protein Bca4012_086064 [Brassica carinata]|uniref:Uncharacterized protein n=1 Tax=Brassica carinata TaxID=52824 RepID=A0A8X7QPJ4_BRACI|nr:hypothetical protein Bca52824_067912 [Brassica carinata]
MLRSPLFLLQSIVSSNLQTTGDASLISPLLPLRRPLLPSLRFSCVHGVTELRFLQSDSTHCFTFDLASAQVHSVAWNSNRTKLASGSVDQTARRAIELERRRVINLQLPEFKNNGVSNNHRSFSVGSPGLEVDNNKNIMSQLLIA